jgi:hypothetical protein
MTVLDARDTLSGAIGLVVESSAAGDDELAGSERHRESSRREWERIINEYLVEWGRDPSQLEDEGVTPPSLEIITLASKIAMELRDRCCPPPLRVVPDGEGGIAFEQRSGDFFLSLNLLHDRSIELETFKNCQLQSRERLA